MTAWISVVKGTSFSAGMVAGVAATILEKKPDLSPKQLKEAILKDYTFNTVSSRRASEVDPDIPSAVLVKSAVLNCH